MIFHRIFAGIASLFVIIALVWGFSVIGSPFTERARKFDDRRIDDLRSIHSVILDIVHEGRPDWMNDVTPILQESLPRTLDDVSFRSRFEKLNISDPETQNPYVYKITGESTYELCAAFNLFRDEPFDVSWNHPAGEHCFRFDALKPDGLLKPKSDARVVPPGAL